MDISIVNLKVWISPGQLNFTLISFFPVSCEVLLFCDNTFNTNILRFLPQRTLLFIDLINTSWFWKWNRGKQTLAFVSKWYQLLRVTNCLFKNPTFPTHSSYLSGNNFKVKKNGTKSGQWITTVTSCQDQQNDPLSIFFASCKLLFETWTFIILANSSLMFQWLFRGINLIFYEFYGKTESGPKNWRLVLIYEYENNRAL